MITGISVLMAFSFFILGCASQGVLHKSYEPLSSEAYVAEDLVERRDEIKDRSIPVRTTPAVGQNEPTLGLEPPQTKRLMVYNARMQLVVENILTTLSNIRKKAESFNGYMKSMDARSIVIKIPASKFNEMIQTIEGFGEVTLKEIKGSDVTEEMQDLTIRLKNAQELRKRFVLLLEKTVKIEDMIKIEKELSRITGVIERLKGRIRFLENQIAYSTITVVLNSPLPQQAVKGKIPFPWVRDLGREIALGGAEYYSISSYIKGPKFELPDSFAKYYETKDLIRATSADGVLVKAHRHKNVEGSSLKFWSDLIKRSLLIEHTIMVTKTTDLELSKKVKAKVIEGIKEIGNQKYDYLVCIAMTKKYVFTYEAWGQNEKFQSSKEEIEASIKTLKISSGY